MSRSDDDASKKARDIKDELINRNTIGVCDVAHDEQAR
jgi:hypothetical protein